MNSSYRSDMLRELRDQQIRYVPREKKMVQAARAEKLLCEIESERNYSYEYICYRITDYRPEGQRVMMVGKNVMHDLRMFIEDITDSADVSLEEIAQPVYTIPQLADRFHVSTKTIARWRDLGLVSRRFIMGGRKRIGFLASSADHFIHSHRDKIQRGEKFSQMTNRERDEIITYARALSAKGTNRSEVARQLASRFSRSVETIRYTLKKFDDDHPPARIFPTKRGKLDLETKQVLYDQYRSGCSAAQLGRQYDRTPSTIHRIVNEMRAREIIDLSLDFVDSDEFHRRGAAKKILAPLPQPEKPPRKARVPKGLPAYLSALYEVPLLTKEQEQHLFRRYNYLKYRADKLRNTIKISSINTSLLDEVNGLYQQAVETKNDLVQANLRLVVSIAKRHMKDTQDFFALVSDGNISLMRAVEKFNYSLGNKFSTYATWAIMKNFARSIPTEFRHQDRFRTSLDELFMLQRDIRTNQFQQESDQRVRQQQVGVILSRLNDREQQIIISRFGLDPNSEPQTLKEVGVEIGVTKERVRQIEAQALDKLRQAVSQVPMELPE